MTDATASITAERMAELRRTAGERNAMVPVGIVAELVGEVDRLQAEIGAVTKVRDEVMASNAKLNDTIAEVRRRLWSGQNP